MFKYIKKIMIIFCTILISLASCSAVSAAYQNGQTIQAYRGVKIVYNGQELTDTSQPYIINNITYIPLRMLMNSFGKNITWDPVNYKVSITHDTVTDLQITALENTITLLESKISTLEAEVAKKNKITTSDIRKKMEEYFDEVGEDYFGDKRIDFQIRINGAKDKLEYTIKLDFDKAKIYDTLEDASEVDIENFLSSIKSRLKSIIKDTNYDGSDISGILYDKDDPDVFVKYNGSSYSYSWYDDIDNIRDRLQEHFAHAGRRYFNDAGIYLTSINLSGDEDKLSYTVKLDFSAADNYDALHEVSQSKIKSFMKAVKSKTNSEIRNTSYEDADITGRLYDTKRSSYFVRYNGKNYIFSWDD